MRHPTLFPAKRVLRNRIQKRTSEGIVRTGEARDPCVSFDLEPPEYSSIARSKLKFKRQLDRTRSANLIEGVEASASQVVVQHHRRLTELSGITQVVDRAAKIGVVEDVEKIRPCLKDNGLGESELPSQG
jgi:hypothetical protein